ncbi:alkaline phosphatase family protein [Myxococcota bacterium]|nr:alkaline phosphatase family protein [Myxococcota bacterium]
MTLFRRLSTVSVALLFTTVPAAGDDDASTSPRRRALVIGIDGLTGPALQRHAFGAGANGALRALMEQGVFTRCDHAGDPRCARAHDGPEAGAGFRYETASGWVSVVTGMNATGHGVRGNDVDEQMVFVETSQQHPTFFRQLRERGFRTAAGGVANFLTSREGESIVSGIVDFECGVENGALLVAWNDVQSCNLEWRRADDLESERRDDNLATWVIQRIDDGQADLVMGVFDEVDAAGHSFGFEDTRRYPEAIAQVDALVRRVLDHVRARVSDHDETWLVMLTSDHGGHDVLFGMLGVHDTTVPADRAVPFVVATYGASESLSALKEPVRHMDVHPTIVTWFGTDPGKVDGQVQGIRGPHPKAHPD